MLHNQPRIEPRLSEIHFGAWEMQAYDRLPRKAINAWAADPLGFRPPQGETANEMLSRVRSATRDILVQRPDSVAVVAHGGSLRAMAGVLLGLPAHEWLGMDFDFGSTTRIDVEESSAALVWCNR